MVGGQNEADLAVALLKFKVAWHALCEASKKNPDYDFSFLYPFYLLDFEVIELAVAQWCSIHAAKLMKNLPDVVDNPACIGCQFFRAGFNKEGLCRGTATTGCNNYPTVVFNVSQVKPFLISLGINLSRMSDDDIHLIYMKECNAHEKAMAATAGESTLRTDDSQPVG